MYDKKFPYKRNRRSFSGFEFGYLIYLLLIVVCLTGYVKNVVKLVKCDFEAPYKSEVLHGVGVVVPPVGFVLGYCELGK